MNKPWRPLLAADAGTDLSALPMDGKLFLSPKYDGIRVTCLPGGPVTRSGKHIPNLALRVMLSDPNLKGLDGEVISGEPTAHDAFNTTTRLVMTRNAPVPPGAVAFYVFDHVLTPSAPYYMRKVALENTMAEGVPSWVRAAPQHLIHEVDQIRSLEELYLSLGYEGVMLRHLYARYKNGRSTLREATLLKLKRFSDAEAEVVGVVPLERNTNDPFLDERGYTKRTTHSAGKVAVELMGSLVCRSQEFKEPFNIGTGFTEAQRFEIWRDRAKILGRRAKFKFQSVGTIDAPRAPVFLGFRSPEDL